jgi:hypothetical protein
MSKRLDVVELELFSVRAESRSRKPRSASAKRQRRAFAAVGTAFVTPDGAL